MAGRFKFNKHHSAILILFLLTTIPLTVQLGLTPQKAKQAAINQKPIEQTFSSQWKSSREMRSSRLLPPPEEIFEINLQYTTVPTSKLRLVNMFKKLGYVPASPQGDSLFTFTLYDPADVLVYQTSFADPTEIQSDLFHEEQLIKPSLQPIRLTEFTITTPWFPNAASFQIISASGAVLLTQKIENVSVHEGKENFRSIRGSEVKDQKSLPSSSVLSATTTQYLDITFIGDNYLTQNDLNTFHNDVEKLSAYLLGYEPFKTRASQIYFHSVDNTTDLECTNWCNTTKVIQAVNNASVPYDKLVVIVKGSDGGTSAVEGLYAVVPGHVPRPWGDDAPIVFVHEFGHLFGLKDEYTFLGITAPLDGKTHANCYAGTPPAAEWQGIVATPDYYKTCGPENWYRSSYSSIMRSLNSQYFNLVSQRLITNQINSIAGSYCYISTSPSSVIISAPSITGLTADVKGTSTIQKVTFTSNNTNIVRVQPWTSTATVTTDTSSPYSTNLYTRFSTGSTSVTVRGYINGVVSCTKSVPVTISTNAGPYRPPPTPTTKYYNM